MIDRCLVEIDFGAIAGTVAVSFEDEGLARTVALLFDGTLSCNSPSLCDHVIGGNVVCGYRFDGTGGSLSQAEVLGCMDSAFDTLIRSRASGNRCSIHTCSVVSPKGDALAIVGTSGTGKTTLGLACARAGFQLMGDEFAFLDLASGRYMHARYPLCLRQNTLSLLGIKPSHLVVPVKTPYGSDFFMIAYRKLEKLPFWESDLSSLGLVAIPRRLSGVRPSLERLSVTRWPEALMPSLDAKMPRDALFRHIVRLFAEKDIAVYELVFDEIKDGVKLVEKIASCQDTHLADTL